jgi:hypothetical protein
MSLLVKGREEGGMGKRLPIGQKELLRGKSWNR